MNVLNSDKRLPDPIFPAIDKKFDTPPAKGINNIGTAGKVDPKSWFGEGGKVSRFANHIPGINAVAGAHDWAQNWFDSITNTKDGLLRTIANVPAMIPAAGITYLALSSDYITTYQILEKTRKR